MLQIVNVSLSPRFLSSFQISDIYKINSVQKKILNNINFQPVWINYDGASAKVSVVKMIRTVEMTEARAPVDNGRQMKWLSSQIIVVLRLNILEVLR